MIDNKQIKNTNEDSEKSKWLSIIHPTDKVWYKKQWDFKTVKMYDNTKIEISFILDFVSKLRIDFVVAYSF